MLHALFAASATHAPPPKILVAYHTETNRTGSLAALVAAGAHEAGADVRLLPVNNISCDDMRWYDGLALGSPVFWGTVSGRMKLFLDEVQQRCFGWPVVELRWRAGAAFATGAHEASGKSATIAALHTFMLSVQMVVLGNEPAANCLLGACATNRNETAPTPTWTAQEVDDARTLGARLVQAAVALRPLMPPPARRVM